MQVHTQCPWPCSRPPLTHSSTGDSWTITGKSGSVSCRITASFSWVLLHPRFCLCPPRVCFPVLYKFWQLYGGFNDDLFQESLCHTQVCCTQSPCPHGRPLLTHTFSGDTQTQFWLSLYGVSGVLWDWSSVFLGLWVVWALWAPLAGEGFDSQYDFAPAIILLGLYLCPWMWGIFFFFFWWNLTFSIRQLFNSELFWSSRRRWAQFPLLCHLMPQKNWMPTRNPSCSHLPGTPWAWFWNQDHFCTFC